MPIRDQKRKILVTDKFERGVTRIFLSQSLSHPKSLYLSGFFGLYVTSDILLYIKSFFQNRRVGAREARLCTPIHVYTRI